MADEHAAGRLSELQWSAYCAFMERVDEAWYACPEAATVKEAVSQLASALGHAGYQVNFQNTQHGVAQDLLNFAVSRVVLQHLCDRARDLGLTTWQPMARYALGELATDARVGAQGCASRGEDAKAWLLTTHATSLGQVSFPT